MKAMMKKIGLALIMGVLACVCLVGCGAIAIDDIKGDWTIDTIDGMSQADYAASLGVDASQCYSNWTIGADKKLTDTNPNGSTSYDIELKGNGFEAKQNGEIQFSVEFNKDAGTLTYEVEMGGKKVKTVMKKGTFDASAAAAEPTEEGSGDVEEPTEDQSGEEGEVEEPTEDESGEEGDVEEPTEDETGDEDYTEGDEDTEDINETE